MNMTSVYKMAVYYVETCHFSVIPLKPNTKVPLIPWQDFQHRLPSSLELQTWFQNNSMNNLGIVTGRISNLSVIDADALEALQKFQTVGSPISVITPRPGRHLYFTYSGETNSASKIAEHIDVRGEGGFVVAPPSVIDGVRYRFVNPVLRVDSLNVFPRYLLDAPESADKSTNGGTNAKPQGWLSQALDSLKEGNRNQSFASIVGRLHRDGLAPADILSFLRPHAEGCSFDLGELSNVIQSVTRYKTGSGFGAGNEIYRSEDKAEDIEEFLKGQEKVEWLVPGVISKSGIGFCAGLPESLKTWILIDLAIECARGGEWLGNKVNKSKVLFLDQERFRGETQRRFKKMIAGKRIDPKELQNNLTIQVGSSIRLNLDDSFNAFRRKLQDIRPELIIVDSFATFSTVAENDRQEVQKVMERIKQLRQEFGCTVLMIDHEGKGVLSQDNAGKAPDAFSIVGSVGKPAAAEVVFTVRKEANSSVTIYNTKNSLAPAIAPITVQLEDTKDDGVVLVKL